MPLEGSGYTSNFWGNRGLGSFWLKLCRNVFLFVWTKTSNKQYMSTRMYWKYRMVISKSLGTNFSLTQSFWKNVLSKFKSFFGTTIELCILHIPDWQNYSILIVPKYAPKFRYSARILIQPSTRTWLNLLGMTHEPRQIRWLVGLYTGWN